MHNNREEKMIALSGGDRTKSAIETLLAVLPHSKRFGITRLTDITRLDRIGIPVYASIRPGAAVGVIRVHNGKGTLKEEAKVGALMEAIEFQAAEFNADLVDVQLKTAKQIEDSHFPPLKFYDFCIRSGQTVNYTDTVQCVEAINLLNHQRCFVPAELVFMPYRNREHRSIFGSSTNGLASGNTLLEASIHAACEIMERDVRASLSVLDTAQLVKIESLPPPLAYLRDKIQEAGIGLSLLYKKSVIGLPFFQAYIHEKSAHAPVAIASGYGLHPNITTAASRAITEAAQSRLTYIHGGRDDTIDRFRYLARKPPEFESNLNKTTIRNLSDRRTKIQFLDIATSIFYSTLEDLWEKICFELKGHDFQHVLRVDLTPKGMPFSVVRLIIPKMEYLNLELRRIGPRLSAMVSGTTRS